MVRKVIRVISLKEMWTALDVSDCFQSIADREAQVR